MGSKQKVYISLGSNMGNRLAHLQKAVFKIQGSIGSVLDISSVYENPAVGFQGNDFLNAMVSVLTPLPPSELLRSLLDIERDLGRVRSDTGGHAPRTLDLDIIYYGNQVVRGGDLTIPHPRMSERNFVLKPLADIAPQFYHPQLNKDTRNLLQECRDRNILTKTKHRLFKDRAGLFSQLQFIAIEGNIGAGKTTLSKMIAEGFNAKLVLERFADNPFLPKFYEDPRRFAFSLEMSFLADRYQQFMDDTSQFDLFKNFMVSDYDIFKSLIFAKVTLEEEEFSLYRKLFNIMYREVRKPEIYLYLYQHTDRLLENIKKRGRAYEQRIEPSYLDKINRGYLDFLKDHPQQNSLIVDLAELDFVARPQDYETILGLVEDKVLNQNF